MKNISTGAGLAILGLGIAVHPLLSGLATSATASASTAPAAAALASAASAQAGPTVVWMGLTSNASYNWVYHRLWSDGRMEARSITYGWAPNCSELVPTGCGTDWVEVTPPPSGNGFACRTDINGDRQVDGADLGILLAG